MTRYSNYLICAQIMVIIASSSCLSGAVDFQCEKEPRISLSTYDKTCKQFTGIKGKDDALIYGASSKFDDVTNRLRTCSCFLVNHRMYWASLLKERLVIIFEKLRDALQFPKSTPATDLDLLLNVHMKFINNPQGKVNQQFFTWLKQDLSAYVLSIPERCMELKKSFSPFRTHLMNLGGTFTDNIYYSLKVAGQDESLATLLMVSHVCHTVYEVNMTPSADIVDAYIRDSS